jgi:hypothetical protein
LTRRLPQRGHIIRSRNTASGMLRSRVQTANQSGPGISSFLLHRGIEKDNHRFVRAGNGKADGA